jgi:YggT family protein
MPTAMRVVGWVLIAYLLVLIARMVMEWIRFANHEWRPRGAGLVAAECAYTITDPPIRLVRRLIPPLRIGSVSLDLGFMLVFFIVATAGQILIRWR